MKRMPDRCRQTGTQWAMGREGIHVSYWLAAVSRGFFIFEQSMTTSKDIVGNVHCGSSILFARFPDCLHFKYSISKKVSKTLWALLDGLHYS
jgi:hypothetical protein